MTIGTTGEEVSTLSSEETTVLMGWGTSVAGLGGVELKTPTFFKVSV